ncbi:MAG TPA: sugar ABC transporter permease [Acidimicrobiales bacterium]|nr:sugar ABC transporter permease [Acidimicrobiales bacterium]
MRRAEARTGALLVTPAFVLVCTFVLFPLAFAIYISLTDWPLIGPYHYIGLTNYRDLFQDPVFIHTVIFTVTYTGIVTGPIFLVGYGLAVLVRSNRLGSKVFRTMFFLPFVVGLTTISCLFTIELQPDSGAVDFVLSKLGLVSDQQAWTVNYAPALLAISVIVVWFASGLTMLILMGAMQAIPADLYEAADADGASWWAKERLITLPLLRRAIALSLIISVIGSFLAFNQFFILVQNNEGLETVVEWVYQTSFENYHLAYGTSMAMLLMVIIALVSAAQFYVLRDRVEL